MEPLVFGNTFCRTGVAYVFKGIFSASLARKQQASNGTRPGSRIFGSIALSFGRYRHPTSKRGWMQAGHGCLWPLLIGREAKPLRSTSVLMHRSTERAGSSTSEIIPHGIYNNKLLYSR